MMLREVIALLMNDEKPLGCYVIEFDASSLLRSLYFYKPQEGNFIESKICCWLRITLIRELTQHPCYT